MTATSVVATITPERRVRLGGWWSVPAGLLAGLALGAVARGWMRLLADDPEFTWSGTLFIVGAFGVAGLGRSIAAVARHATSRRAVTTPARIAAAVLMLPMFSGAGALMLPTVALGAFAAWRPLRRPLRIALALAAAVPVVLLMRATISEAGLDLGTVLGLALFAATYGAVLASLGAIVAPVADGWRLPRWARTLALAAALLVVGVVVVSAVGFR